jgi:hypothetical protein
MARHSATCLNVLLSGVFAMSLFAAPVFAHTIVFTAPFLPEGGPGSTGSGTAVVTFDTDLFTMHVQGT